MITFQTERLADCCHEMEPLFPLHYAETGELEGGIDMAWEQYFAMEQAGMLFLLTARYDGKLVGYFVGIVMPNLHNRKRLAAVSDMYFLHPDHRGHAGIRIFREVEQAWRAMGVELATITCKVSRNYAALFERLGWRLEEKVFIKEL
ncbi:GNAT family N-acetyltransferase [Terriglobus sp. 2YAB30_2]|uniref:GNAT family N-acetyltransferase n=1 Tax=Terriglobus sp. 2YAB30_2 TaxID=3233023 RepID=UPI003F995B9C